MMKIFLFNFLIMMSIIMFFLNHPLSMGLLILFQTLMLSLILGMLTKTYWFSYILFITFLGGLLVLFIYVSSVASNELFSPKLKLNLLIFIMFFLMMMISFYLMNNLNMINMIFNMDMLKFNEVFLFKNENKFNLSKLYNSQTYFLMMMMIIYLFITLIATVKITNIYFGTLRASN